MSKLVTYTEVFNKLKNGESGTKSENSKLFDAFKKDIQQLNDSDWEEVEAFIILCIECRSRPAMNFATALLKKKNCIDWKVHSDTMTKIIKQVSECGGETLTPEQETDTYREFMDVFVKLLRSVKLFEQNKEMLFQMVKTALSPERNGLQSVINNFTEHLPWVQNTKWGLEVMERTYEIIQANPEMDQDNRLASCIIKLWTHIFNATRNNDKKAADYVDTLKKIMAWCKEAEWYDANDSSKHTLNHKLVLLILDGFIRMHKDQKELLKPFMEICKALWECEDEEMVDHVTTFMTMMSGGTAAEVGGYDVMMKLINMLLTGEDSYVICNFQQAYPKCPEPFNEKLEDLASHLEHIEDSLLTSALMFFQAVAGEHTEVFTASVVEKMVNTLSNEGSFNMALIALVPVVEARPELLEPHQEAIIKSMHYADYLMMYAQGGNILAKLAVTFGDEDRARRYMKLFAEIMETAPSFVRLCLVINMKTVGGKFTVVLAEYKDLFENYKSDPMLTGHCNNALDDIAGRTLGGVVKDIQEAQEDIEELDDRVVKTDDNIENLMAGIDVTKIIAEAIKEDAEDHQQRMDNIEDDVEDIVQNVEEIDKKTLSHTPLWAKDVSKLMNDSSDNNWRMLAERLNYTDDIENWSTQTNPCLSMFEAWFTENKTKEATLTILAILEEIDRTDAFAIVENALKVADGVIVDAEAESMEPTEVFISYQWSIQNEVTILKTHLEMAGYKVWMDVGQMGGGEQLFEKIDAGVRGAKVFISCVTEKYAKSPNCNREVNLSVNLKKPMIPLLMEKMSWPPKGSMGPIFGESLFIRFFSRPGEETTREQFWPSSKFQELLLQIRYNVAPNPDLIQDPYKNWLSGSDQFPATGKKNVKKNEQKTIKSKQVKNETDVDPDVFISYQWGKQPQIKELYAKLSQLQYSCWLDIEQMGGGDSLYEKIDKGIRNSRVVLTCVTSKYLLSANCKREASLAKSLNKPIVVLLLENMHSWPPEGPAASVFKDAPCIDFTKVDEGQVNIWKSPGIEELERKLMLLVNGESMKQEDQQERSSDENLSQKDLKNQQSDVNGQNQKQQDGEQVSKEEKAENSSQRDLQNQQSDVNGQNQKQQDGEQVSKEEKAENLSDQKDLQNQQGRMASIAEDKPPSEQQLRMTTGQTSQGSTKSEPSVEVKETKKKSSTCVIL